MKEIALEQELLQVKTKEQKEEVIYVQTIDGLLMRVPQGKTQYEFIRELREC